MKKSFFLMLLLLSVFRLIAQEEKLIIYDWTDVRWVYPDSPLYPYGSFQPKVTAWPEYTGEQLQKKVRQSNQISRKIFTWQELQKLSKNREKARARVVLLCNWKGEVQGVSYLFPLADTTVLTESKLRVLTGEWKKQVMDFNFQRSPIVVPEKEKTVSVSESIYDFSVK